MWAVSLAARDPLLMNWSDTRRKLLELAARRASRRGDEEASARRESQGYATVRPPGSVEVLRPQAPRRRRRARVLGETRLALGMQGGRRPGRGVRAHSVCVASGKGGTGKSVTTAALATLLSDRGRTLIVDGDLGVGNAHILQDVSPPKTLADVVDGRHSAREVLTRCSGQVELLAGGSGIPRMASLSSYELHLLAAGLEELELEFRHCVLDSAAGVSRQTISFARACDLTLVVTTPDLTAMTDAYAFIKVLAAKAERRPMLLVNRAHDEEQAQQVAGRIRGVCERFLGGPPRLLGWVPEDPLVAQCVNRRGSVTQLEPEAPASLALRRVAVAVLDELSRHHAGGLGSRLLDEVGYPSQMGVRQRR